MSLRSDGRFNVFTQEQINESWSRSPSRQIGNIEQAEGCERAALNAEAGKYGPNGAEHAAAFRKRAARCRARQAAIDASWAELV